MRYPRTDGKRRKNTQRHAEQSARLEDRRSKDPGTKIRNRVSAAGDKSRDISSSGRRNGNGTSREADQAFLYQAVRSHARQGGGIRVTKQVLERYPFQVRPLTVDEGGGYLMEFPDVPGCMSDGETPEEAIVHGRDALKSALLTMTEFGDPIPLPGSFTRSSGQWRQRVPKSLHARLAARAGREGVSLNLLVTTLIAEGLGRRDATSGPPVPATDKDKKPAERRLPT